MTPIEIIRSGPPRPARPWPRHALSALAWRDLSRALARHAEPRFEALWADAEQVYALFTNPDPVLVSAPVEAGVYAALSPARPQASLFERAIGDLWGYIAADARDTRPWLDHGAWPVLHPMLARQVPNPGPPAPPELRPTPSGCLRIEAGPLGGATPALIALAAKGETLVAAETRLGYAHRGVLALLRGKTPAEAAPLVARLSGPGTVAHGLAFAQAVEAALRVEIPPRAAALRAVAAGVEQVAVGLADLAGAAEAAGFDPAPWLDPRETLLRASLLAFGHRLLLDVVVPGGTARDLTPEGPTTLADALAAITLPSLDGVTRRRVGLAGLRARDATLRGALASLPARLGTLPEGSHRAVVTPGDGEGLGQAAGARGAHWHWVDLRAGRIAEAFACDPAWLLWPALEAAAPGLALGDYSLLRAASGVSSPGADL